MFLDSENRFREIGLIVAGVAGIFWFYFSYQKLDPVASLQNAASKERIFAKTDSTLDVWQMLPPSLKQRAKMESYRGLADSIQKIDGIDGFFSEIKSSQNKQFPIFYWDIQKYEQEQFYIDGDYAIQANVTTSGEVFSFSIRDRVIKEFKPHNIRNMNYVFGLDFESTSQKLALRDSLISKLLAFQSMEFNDNSELDGVPDMIKRLGGSENLDLQDVFSYNGIWESAAELLEDTYWNRFEFSRDSMEFKEGDGIRYARLHLTAQNSIFDFYPTLQLDLLPAGGVRAIRPGIKTMNISPQRFSDILEPVALFFFLCFGIWLVSVFYLRIKARAIDTQPAFVIAVLAGFLLSASQALNRFSDIEFNFEYFKNINLAGEFFVLGLVGAVAAVIFFVLTSVSDSISRQHWPEKLKSWDLARRGFFKNKPIGRTLILAICMAGISVGIWTMLVQIIPGIHIDPVVHLMSTEYVFPSVAVILQNLLASILLVTVVFMILGNQAYSLTSRKWPIPILSGLLLSVFLDPFISIDVHPYNYSLIINFIMGVVIGLFYIQFGFLTMVLGLFSIAGIFSTKNGWVFSNSPDALTFYVFAAILVSMAAFGIYFIRTGSEKKDLPDYVPEYIEQQARGERINQELKIARIVQQTFLPSREVQLPGIDIAGICDPAQETGGDYYDMISIGKNRTAIAIGDVSGKGIQAAFYMTFVKGVLHSLSALILSPLELLNQLNRLFKENATRGTFITMIYGILEAEKRTFTFARAGHNPMLLVKANGDVEWIQSKGVGIGVAESSMFGRVTEEVELKLKEGDVAVLYTDGVTEMMNISNQFYGEDRLERLVKGIRKGTSSKILEIIIGDVLEFKGVAKQHDDMTVVVIKADSSVNK